MWGADQALIHAAVLMRAGNYGAAIEPLRDVLTADPESADAHDRLAQCLLHQNRLSGAMHEARAAIALRPTASDFRLTLAGALAMRQQMRDALAEVDAAIELDPRNAAAHLLRARLLRHRGRRAESAASLVTALDLAPGDVTVLAEVGYAALERNDMPVVEDAARAILAADPGQADGLVLMGRVQLAAHEDEEAMQLALAALSRSPTDLEALSLLAAAKMKRNVLGGLWWRWNRLLVRLGEQRAIFLVVGIWVLYRWLSLAAEDAGLPQSAGLALTVTYLGFVLYTLSAGVIVERMVRKEVARVRLNPRF